MIALHVSLSSVRMGRAGWGPRESETDGSSLSNVWNALQEPPSPSQPTRMSTQHYRFLQVLIYWGATISSHPLWLSVWKPSVIYPGWPFPSHCHPTMRKWSQAILHQGAVPQTLPWLMKTFPWTKHVFVSLFSLPQLLLLTSMMAYSSKIRNLVVHQCMVWYQ